MQDKECQEAAFEKFESVLDRLPKLTYKVKEICGDYYYEKMTKQETLQKAFYSTKKGSPKELRSQNDINMYIRDNMNQKNPLDGPLWSLYA